MTTEEHLTDTKRRHELDMTVSTIAYILATSEEWDGDTLDTIANTIAEVAPHPGTITPGNCENYVNDLMSAQLPVSWAMIADAQALDAQAQENTPEEINICQDCHERRDRPPVIDYPTNPFIMCHDCNADTDLLAIANPATKQD